MNIDEFKSGLKKLTVNKRVIIDDLTTFAEKYSADAAEEIAAAIHEHIRTCPPQHKLLAFYLLDNISKTVGNPYNILLANGLYQLFKDTYVIVDDGTRHRLIELFRTWEHYENTSVFNMQVLENIEKFIQQAQNLRSASPGLESLSKSELTPRILIQNAKDLLKLHDELILQVENFVKGDYHKFLLDDDFCFIEQFKQIQVQLYELINEILRHIYEDVNSYHNGKEKLVNTPQFNINAGKYKIDIVRNQKELFKQQQSLTDFLATCKPRLHKAYMLKKEKREKIKYLKKYRFVIEKRPNTRFFSHVLNESEEFIDLIDKFGKVAKFTPEELLFVNEPQLIEPPQNEAHDHQINSNFLGFPVDIDSLKEPATTQDKAQESILGLSINLDSLLGSGNNNTRNSNGSTDKLQDLAPETLSLQLSLHQQQQEQPMAGLSILSSLPFTSILAPTTDQPPSIDQPQPVWSQNNTLNSQNHENKSLTSDQSTQHDKQMQLTTRGPLEVTRTRNPEQDPDPQPVLSTDRPKPLEENDGVITYYPIFGDQPSLVNNGSFRHPRKVFRRLVQAQSIGDLTLKYIPEFFKQYEIDINLPNFPIPSRFPNSNQFPVIPEFRVNETNLDSSSISNGDQVLQIEYHKDTTENGNTELANNGESIKESEVPKEQPVISTNEGQPTVENDTSAANEQEVHPTTSTVQSSNTSAANEEVERAPQTAPVLPPRKLSLNDYRKIKMNQANLPHSPTSQSLPPPPPPPPPPPASSHSSSNNKSSERSRLTDRQSYSSLAIPSNRPKSNLKRKGTNDEPNRRAKQVKFANNI